MNMLIIMITLFHALMLMKLDVQPAMPLRGRAPGPTVGAERTDNIVVQDSLYHLGIAYLKYNLK